MGRALYDSLLAEARLVALILRGGINPPSLNFTYRLLDYHTGRLLETWFIAVTEVDHYYELNIQKFSSYQTMI